MIRPRQLARLAQHVEDVLMSFPVVEWEPNRQEWHIPLEAKIKNDRSLQNEKDLSYEIEMLRAYYRAGQR